jgi:hypothetical protein
MKNKPEGFRYTSNKDGNVTIFHHGKLAANMKGNKAARFLIEVALADEDTLQMRMAKLTGNYKRGNEKTGKTQK